MSLRALFVNKYDLNTSGLTIDDIHIDKNEIKGVQNIFSNELNTSKIILDGALDIGENINEINSKLITIDNNFDDSNKRISTLEDYVINLEDKILELQKVINELTNINLN
jgi:hypothetical protein